MENLWRCLTDKLLCIQDEKLARNGGTSRRKNAAEIDDDESSSDSDDDSTRPLSYRTPFLTQASYHLSKNYMD